LADSFATRTDLVRLLNVPPEKITVVWLAANPIYCRWPPVQTAAHLAPMQLAPGYILFTGTLEPRKNIPGLLAAYRLLCDKITAPALVLAGRRGWLYADIFTQIEKLKLAARVRFIENPTDEMLVALYNGASMLALPSFYEGFGLPVLEAMACGAPVLAAQCASLPEIAGSAAWLLDPHDHAQWAAAMLALLEDAARRTQMIEAGHVQAAHFTWAKTAHETLAVYRLVLT
jgi:glycosyltransferase involved in cell wall biosynthesis